MTGLVSRYGVRWPGLAIVAAALCCALPSSAQAFDTGPHADLTRDALTSEGFGLPSANIAAVNNWFVDYYTNPGRNPYSGHAGFWIGLTRAFAIAGRPAPRGFVSENWRVNDVEGARKMHFDAESGSTIYLGNTAGIEREWDRLEHMTRRLLRLESERGNPLGVLSIIGFSLHAVQDFYSHSNWVEETNFGVPGGPDVDEMGYGSHPTWFDIPQDVRRTFEGPKNVYTGVEGRRGHGHWRSNSNNSLLSGLNKDWPGRPKYDQAYITAYFAARQWLRAMRTWLGNEPLWNRAMSMPHSSALAHDLDGATDISKFSGHWQGGGEPGVACSTRPPGFPCGDRTGKAGSLTSLVEALGDYHSRGPTPYRRAFTEIVGEGRIYPEGAHRPDDPEDPNDLPDYPDLPSSRGLQALTRFVKLEVLKYKALGLGDPLGNDADVYANARINGQPYTSTIINGEDSFSFAQPYEPFMWIRSVPTANQASTPVTSMTVRVETGNRRNAGTDDDVYLAINGRQRFNLDKAAYDDFERGDDDTYSVPIGAATKNGLTVGDIQYVSIEKSRDGRNGGWFLRGVTLNVNGQQLVSDRAINRWLEKTKRGWTAPNFTRDDRTADVVAGWLELKDDDWGTNDTGDVNVYDRHTSFPIAYYPGEPLEQAIRGGALLMGRRPMANGDSARLTYRFSTLTVMPPPPPPPPDPLPPPPPPGPPPSGPAPDLVISSFTNDSFTVKNQGTAAAGFFRVTVSSGQVGHTHYSFPSGLAAGASETRMYSRPCDDARTVLADSNYQVNESDENNNSAQYANEFC